MAAWVHRDKEKDSLLHDSKTVRPQSVRITLAVAAVLGWRISSTDVDQAYLQSTFKWKRVVYMRPPPKLGLPADALLRLKRPIYGLADAGDHWYHSLEEFPQSRLCQQRGLACARVRYRTLNKE